MYFRMETAWNNHPDGVKVLIDSGADVNARSKVSI